MNIKIDLFFLVMLIWLNWATVVVVISEPVWPTWTSLLEALVSRTTPVRVSKGLAKICHSLVCFFPKPSEGCRKTFRWWCRNPQISPRSCFVVLLFCSHRLGVVLSRVCCAWHFFTAHLDALLCVSQTAAGSERASQSFAEWPDRGLTFVSFFSVWEGCKAPKYLSDALISALL